MDVLKSLSQRLPAAADKLIERPTREEAEAAVRTLIRWAGGWIGAARICRCGPFGTAGLDLVPETLPDGSAWYKPWAYGRWRGVNAPPAIACEAVEPDGERSSS